MKITYLGQAGLCFECSGKKILIDPYLSDSVSKTQPQNTRRQPIDAKWLSCKPDVIIITHAHGDHYDKETLKHYLNAESDVLVLSPSSVWSDVRNFGGNNRYVLFDVGTEWTEGNVSFRAVKAAHSDAHAIGVVLNAEGKNYYITGDTLYNEGVFDSLPDVNFDAVFLPINGVGNNMNFADAARFAARVGASKVVPVHIGMFDDLTADGFVCPNVCVPKIYHEIVLD